MSHSPPGPVDLYPPALAAEVAMRWQQLDPPGEPLPSQQVLEQLFDALYQASLLTEESRRVRCRVIFAEPGSWPVCEGPPTGFHMLSFAEPCALEPHELRKLALAAAYHRALLGVRQAEDGRLEIWGMINSGARWVSRTDGGRYHGVPLPRHLVAHVTAPGRIAVSCGYGAVLNLPTPGAITEGLDPFQSQWLASHFRGVRTQLRESFNARRGPGAEIEDGFIRLVAQNTLRRTLSLVRDSGHGGMLLFLPEGWLHHAESPVAFNTHSRFAPGQNTARFHNLLLDAMQALSEAAARHGFASAGWSHYQQLNDPQLAEVDEAFFEMSHLLADLMAVDGALVVSKTFELLGFGAEVLGRAETHLVQRALDLEGTRKLPERADRAGTRHRAAYRFVTTVPESLAIVVSQDATVRFITAHESSATYWNYAP